MPHSLHDPIGRARYAAHVSWTPDHAVSRLKEDGPRSVWLVQRPGQELRTAKFWTLSPWLLVKHVLGISQPSCQARGARWLSAAGIPTPEVVAGPSIVTMHGRRLLQIELNHVPGENVLDLLERGDARRGQALEVARQVGALIFRIADAGLFHRDLKASNIVIEESASGPRIWVIDPVGVRRCRSRSTAVFRMLERLDVEIRERRSIAMGTWSSVVRAALRPLSGPERQAVFELLRAHPRP